MNAPAVAVPSAFGDFAVIAVLVIVLVVVGYLVWQHHKNPAQSIGAMLGADAGAARDRVTAEMRGLLDKQASATPNWPPPALDADFTAGLYFDIYDVLYAAGQHGVTQAIRIDGKPVRSGAGPGIDFWTQKSGGFGSKQAPASVTI